MTTRERAALNQYPYYQQSCAHDLSYVYDRYSTAKAVAWKYCEDLMAKHDGWGLRVISHNCFMFTAGFLFRDPDTHALKFMYITKTYDQAVEV